jgi:4-hydroxybenzoyl-CoA reductase subunit beta
MLRLHPYVYHRPRALEEALELLERYAGDVLPIAGGTDLVPNMKHKLFTPGHLVALRGLPELRGIELRDGHLRIGAVESLHDLSVHPLLREHAPALATACAAVSGPQLRRMGTIGGNVCLDTRCTYYNQTLFWRKALGYCLKKDGEICHVVPGGTRCVAAHSADTPPVLMALGASVDIAGPEGLRSMPLSRLFTSNGIWNRRMEATEIVVAVDVPLPSADLRMSFQKLRPRGSIDFSLVNLAVVARLDGEGVVMELEMVISALGSYPRRIGKVEEAAAGNRLTASVIDAVAEQAFRQCHPLENITTDAEWRRAMVPVLVRRALKEIAA